MVRQQFDVDGYWKVIVWYDADYSLFHYILKDLMELGMNDDNIEEVYQIMRSRKAKAVTCSDIKGCMSVIIFNSHKSKRDYLNSIVHEAEHVKQAMLKAYGVEDRGEAPAYTIGYLVGRMWTVFNRIVYYC